MINENVNYRICRAFIPGTVLHFAQFGLYGKNNTLVGPEAKPVAEPDNMGKLEFPYLTLGKAASASYEPQRNNQTASGVSDNGRIVSVDLSTVTQWIVKFSTQWGTPEGLQMGLGSASQLVDGTGLAAFESDGKMDGWLHGYLRDLTAGGAPLLHWCAEGTLRRASGMTHDSKSPTANDYEFLVRYNIMNSIEPVQIQNGGFPIYDDTAIPTITPSFAPIPNN